VLIVQKTSYIDLTQFFRNFLLIVSLNVIALTVSAQGQSDNWYFGTNAGVNFGSCIPTKLLDGQMNTDEGVATISDATGNLLLYSDGQRVWDRQHSIMPNGFGLFGDPSSTHSAVIVPQPGNDSIFFVFTVDNEGNNKGLCYSVVNLNRNSGLGDVVLKNQLLLANAHEKVAAIAHSNQTDFWVVTREFGSVNYYSWLVNSGGVQNAPVVSSTPNSLPSNADNISRGYLRISSDGKKIASAYAELSYIEMSDFNSTTGIVSGTFNLNSSLLFAPQYILNAPYGIEFSPDNRLMYVTGFYSNGNSSNIFLTQYNVENYNAQSITASQIAIDSGGSFANPNRVFYGGLQLARNGKIYVSEYSLSQLGVINTPNASGTACSYQFSGINLSPKICRLGLPTFIQSYVQIVRAYDFNLTEDCSRNVSFNIVTSSAYDSVRWYFNGLLMNPANTSTAVSPIHSYTADGEYEVSLVVYYSNGCSGLTDTIRRTIRVGNKYFDLGSSRSFCEGGQLTLDAFVAGATSYSWNTNQTSSSIVINVGGTYSCNVEINNCIYSDSVMIIEKPVPVVDLGIDTTICEGQQILIDATSPNATYLWQDNTILPSIIVNAGGFYSVKVTVDGCSASDTIKVEVENPPVVDLGEDRTICPNQPITLSTEVNSEWDIQWQDGSTGINYTVNSTGLYSIDVTNKCGTSQDQVVIENGICSIQVPSVFTPNQDFLNDVFRIRGIDNYSFFHLAIYNRFGKIVFESKQSDKGWDGNYIGLEQPTGGYVWILQYAESSSQKINMIRGSVLLIR